MESGTGVWVEKSMSLPTIQYASTHNLVLYNPEWLSVLTVDIILFTIV